MGTKKGRLERALEAKPGGVRFFGESQASFWHLGHDKVVGVSPVSRLRNETSPERGLHSNSIVVERGKKGSNLHIAQANVRDGEKEVGLRPHPLSVPKEATAWRLAGMLISGGLWHAVDCGQEFLWAVETKRNKRPLLITQVARHQLCRQQEIYVRQLV